MKKHFYLLMIFSLVIAACDNEDDNPTPDPVEPIAETCSDGIQNNGETGIDCGGECNACVVELEGTLAENTTLSSDNQYELAGALIVPDGITLTIGAGTTIKATGGTSAYIAVAQGGKINVFGTAEAPVIMTSAADSPAPGDWGGLVVCGKAPTNVGDTATSEVGDLTYGGTDATDNSGTIKYLRVEYTGATFNSEKEFNGVSLFGVGNGTVFEYVQSFEGGDDGIEFFGGTVNGKYLVSTGSGDDSIDFADGWSGNGSYWYISEGAKAGIEGSNNGDNGDATPVTTTQLSNITVVGPVTEGALYFKEGGGNWTIDNFYASGVDLGIKVKSSDAEANARLAAAALNITNFQFADAPEGLVKTDYTGDTSWLGEGVATGAGNGAAVPDWAQGWTTGLSGTTASKANLEGTIDSEVTLNANVEYQLTSAFVVQDGGILNIPAGTVIKATGGTSAYIAVAQGGKINVNGSATAPVVMTSGQDSPSQGDWGGLVICGKAPTNVGDTATSEVGDLTYGGTETNDNSGSIRYLRVEYTGATFTNEKEFNGVSLFGVGAGTTFEYVQSYEGGDDGIEFFGGTVNGSYLVSTGSGDDSIDFADGWAGTGNYWYIKDGAKAGIEGSNNGDNGDATPVTTATLKNITVVGPVTEGALYYKEGGGNFTVSNFYASGVNLGIKVKSSDAEANTRISNGDLSVTNWQFADNADGFKISDIEDTSAWFSQGPTNGAGNGAAAPEWTAGWTLGLENSSASSKADLQGNITGEVTLNATTIYELSSAVVVKDGGILNIPAGTTIKATGGTSSYIAVAQGGKINVNGSANAPVVMTSGQDNPAAGDWGGLVICGKAPTNVGDTATSEVGDLTYGGTETNDNSGSIRYLRVEYTGATFTNEKEFNGVSLFGVGAGTTFEYVQSYEGGDDGIEFFGGSVTGDYLISTNSGDDSIDFCDGWSGSGNNWYIKGGAKAGIEGSNNGDNGDATPVTNATLTNVSIVGPVTEGALYYKEGGGTFTITNFFVSGLEDEVVKVKDSDTAAIARLNNGDLTITNLTGAADKASISPDFDFTNYANISLSTDGTGAGNGASLPDWAAGWSRE